MTTQNKTEKLSFKTSLATKKALQEIKKKYNWSLDDVVQQGIKAVHFGFYGHKE